MPVKAKHLLLLLFFALTAAAQDAARVLQLTVGYGTLKNSTHPTAEKRAELEPLEQKAREASAAGRYGEAMKHLYHGMAVMRGEEWTPWRVLNAALTLKVNPAVLEPGQAVRVELGQWFALDEKPEGKVTAAISLLPLKDEQPEKALKTVGALAPDWSAAPLVGEVKAPDVEDGNYRLAVTLKAEGVKPITKAVPVHIEKGLAARLAALKARVAKLEAKSNGNGNGNAARPEALPSVEYRIALYDLAAASTVNLDRIDFKKELQEAETFLGSLEAGRDPFAALRGDFRKAYRSKVDNTLQPYRIFVPSRYDGSKAFPLIVALHGMGRDENSYFDDYANGAFKAEAERRGYFVACPKGRQPASMYAGPAEQDVLDVIEEMKRAYRIDPDRIYLTGHSMGGFGTWSVAMNHPDVFAALAPIAGGGNPSNMAKIVHIPQLVVHGDADRTVLVERSRVMVEAARKLGAEVNYIEVPGGSHGGVAAPTFKDVYDWFDAHKRDQKAVAAGSKQ